MKRVRLAIVACGILASSFLVSVASAPPVHAYNFLPCKYSGSDPNIGVQIASSVPSGLQDRTREAFANWNATNANGEFKESIAWTKRVTVQAGSYSSTSWAWVSGSCPAGGGNWASDLTNMYINTSTLDGIGANGRRRILIHEFGHSLGLDHASMTCSGTPKVMEQGENKFECSGTAPWSDDVNGVIVRYL